MKGLDAAAEDAALAHDWPGNVRELRNRAERAVALAQRAWLGPLDLFPDRPPAVDVQAGEVRPLATARDEAERRAIAHALARSGGRIQEAARLLAVSRTTLWQKIKKLGLTAGG